MWRACERNRRVYYGFLLRWMWSTVSKFIFGVIHRFRKLCKYPEFTDIYLCLRVLCHILLYKEMRKHAIVSSDNVSCSFNINMSHMPQILIRFVPLLFDRFIPQYNFAYVCILNITSHGFLYSASILHTHTLQNSYNFLCVLHSWMKSSVGEAEKGIALTGNAMNEKLYILHFLRMSYVCTLIKSSYYSCHFVCPLFSVHFVSAFIAFY